MLNSEGLKAFQRCKLQEITTLYFLIWFEYPGPGEQAEACFRLRVAISAGISSAGISHEVQKWSV
jgi:hypothetical protein